MKEQILANLPGGYPWADRLHWFDSIGSTNDEAKHMAMNGAPHGTVLVAGHQTNGHGRLGRSFHSPQNVGVYMTLLLRPDCRPQELMHLTCATAVAMCDAIQTAAGIRPGVKWTNDLVFDRRKVGGILTELGFKTDGSVDYAIIGIGLNCGQRREDFPQEIRNIATSLEIAAGTPIDHAQIAAAMMDSLHQLSLRLTDGKADLLKRYRQDCITIGQDVSILRDCEASYGTALDVDENGALVVHFSDGRIQPVHSGEVSIRGMYGYV